MIRHLGVLIILLALNSFADEIEFSEDELSQESVYPKFDIPVAVKKKSVNTDSKLELHVMGGWTLNDAINNPFGFGGILTYHLTDIHGLELYTLFFSSSLSSYATQLQANPTFGLTLIDQIPKPQYAIFGAYEITPYYGKISITKQTVWNLMLYGTLGGGMMAYQNANNFGFSIGIGQKIYFSKQISLITDLRYLIYQGPNPIYNTVGANGPVFSNQPVTNAVFSVGLGYIF